MTEDVAGRFIGTCELQSDMTWALELAPEVAHDDDFMDELAERRAAFERRYDFYRRAAAFALSYSLGRSMVQSGIRGLSYDEAMGRLTHDPGE